MVATRTLVANESVVVNNKAIYKYVVVWGFVTWRKTNMTIQPKLYWIPGFFVMTK